MKVSRFIKPHKDILIEYIYDDGNNISEPYKILQNIRDNSLSYIAGSASVTGNSQNNQLVLLDAVTNNYGLVDTNTYNFLQVRDYASGFPNRHDTIKVHIPINWTFGEYLGFHVNVYAYDFTNEKTYTLSDFFFDLTDVNQSYLLNLNAPPLLFQEKLWGKSIDINIPSVYSIARQRIGTSARANTINSNVTGGSGFSLTSPVFIDFNFIAAKRTINRVTTYTLAAKIPMIVPQAPDFENLGVQIAHSSFGDYFEIFGVFNGDINQFDDFINNSIQFGNKYYVTYTVTLFEQNIRGKSFTITVTDNFNEKIEYRPIIKYSTTTAIIDVEMNVIDAVDNSSIYRRASYGMLQDQVSKYSLNLTKINLANANKPKIYNIKSPEGAGIFGSQMTNGSRRLSDIKPQIVLEPVKVNYAVLVDRYNVIAKSESVTFGGKNFFGYGKMELLLQPFDNVVTFRIAKDQSMTPNGNSTTVVAAPEYMDLSNMGDIQFIIKNDTLSFEANLYFQSNEVELGQGFVAFRIPSSRMSDIKKIADSGMNLFYIVSRTDTGVTVIYTGLFKIYDTRENVNALRNSMFTSPPAYLVLDNSRETGIANATRRTITTQVSPNTNQTIKDNPSIVPKQKTTDTSNNNNNSTTSTPSATIVGGVNYTIGADSSLTIDGYRFTNNDLKKALGLPSAPTNLSMKDSSLYSNDQILDNLLKIKKRLQSVIINTPELKALYDSTQAKFRADNPTTNPQAVGPTIGAQVTTVGTQSFNKKYSQPIDQTRPEPPVNFDFQNDQTGQTQNNPTQGVSPEERTRNKIEKRKGRLD
jgi:hypothetical protein